MKKRIRKGSIRKNIFASLFMFLISSLMLATAFILLYRPEPEIADTPKTVTDPAEKTPERREGVYNFLILGRDRVGYNTDVIILASYDTVNGGVRLVQIPRDTYYDGRRINTLFYSYYREYRDSVPDAYDAAMKSVCADFRSSLGIAVDYYALINLDGFVRIVDAVGGIRIDVPFAMDYEDPEQELFIHLTAGEQVLDGAMAEQFVRYRAGYKLGDIDRVNVQKLFISAFFESARQNLSLSSIDEIAKIVYNEIKTSASFMDMIYFMKSALALDSSNVVMTTMPGTQTQENGTFGKWYYVLNREGASLVASEWLNVYQAEYDATHFDVSEFYTDEDNEYIHSIYSEKNQERKYYCADHVAADIQIYQRKQ